jgi:hypothetical protein
MVASEHLWKKWLAATFYGTQVPFAHPVLETKVLLTMHSERVALCGLHRLES